MWRIDGRISWATFVDSVTVLWLIVFALGLLITDEQLARICISVNLGLLPVFVVDVFVQYRRSPKWRIFLKENWVDIVMVIPFFRVFRIVRVVRFLRLVRVARFATTARSGSRLLETSWKSLKAVWKGKKLQKGG
ncbi:MAG: ion transporter [Nitrospinota bacterium]